MFAQKGQRPFFFFKGRCKAIDKAYHVGRKQYQPYVCRERIGEYNGQCMKNQMDTKGLPGVEPGKGMLGFGIHADGDQRTHNGDIGDDGG